MDELSKNIQTIFIVISAIITIASVIVKLTPSKSDDKKLDKIIKVLQFLSLYKKDK